MRLDPEVSGYRAQEVWSQEYRQLIGEQSQSQSPWLQGPWVLELVFLPVVDRARASMVQKLLPTYLWVKLCPSSLAEGPEGPRARAGVLRCRAGSWPFLFRFFFK